VATRLEDRTKKVTTLSSDRGNLTNKQVPKPKMHFANYATLLT